VFAKTTWFDCERQTESKPRKTHTGRLQRAHAILELVARTGIRAHNLRAWRSATTEPQGPCLHLEGSKQPTTHLPGMWNSYQGPSVALQGLFFLFLFRRHGRSYITLLIYIYIYTNKNVLRIWGALGLLGWKFPCIYKLKFEGPWASNFRILMAVPCKLAFGLVEI
jgi:hypothetical protein